MPQTHTITTYAIGELPPAALERALKDHRACDDYPEWDWSWCVQEDFREICDILGFEIRVLNPTCESFPLPFNLDITFSVACTQNDGASFTGTYGYAKNAPRRIRAYAPQDAKLHELADSLQSLQQRNFYQLHARIHRYSQYGPSVHNSTMRVDLDRDNDRGQEPTDGADREILRIARELADWLYKQLQQSWEYHDSDDARTEYLAEGANARFLECGRLCDCV